MRYQQLLENTKTKISKEQAWDLIKTKAQPFLKAVDYNVPLRGTNGPDIFVSSYRTDRKSKAEEYELRTAIEEKLKEKNAKATRTNAIPVTNSMINASKFGVPYFIFPLGKFHYHWYRNSYDLNSDYWSYIDYITDGYGVRNMSTNDKAHILNNFAETVDIQVDENIDEWGQYVNNELFVNSSDGYLAIRVSYFFEEFHNDFIELYPQSGEKMYKKYRDS